MFNFFFETRGSGCRIIIRYPSSLFCGHRLLEYQLMSVTYIVYETRLHMMKTTRVVNTDRFYRNEIHSCFGCFGPRNRVYVLYYRYACVRYATCVCVKRCTQFCTNACTKLELYYMLLIISSYYYDCTRQIIARYQ